MKKLLFVFGIAFALVSCEEIKYYNISATNASTTKSVSYTYNGISDTLVPSQTKIYEIYGINVGLPKNIVDQHEIASLVTEYNSMNFTFRDAPSLDLKVINTLPVNITIKADKYIDNNGSTELTINSNTQSTGAKIYTKNPKFTSTTNYPIKVEYTIVGNEMSVTIR